MNEKHYDYFVIGAGSGGVRSARIAAAYGAHVGIAEGAALGGTCVNLGCVPKKLLAYGSDYAAHFEDSRGYGWSPPEKINFSWKTLISNKNKEIERLNSIYQTALEKPGVEIIRGFARFLSANKITVNNDIITADKFLIATGGLPRIPGIPGGELMATSDDVFHWPDLPKHVVIQGGGYIGVEFAHILHGLGAHVILLHRGDLLLRGFDQDLREALGTEMLKQGIDLRLACDIEKVEKNGPRYSVYTTTGDIIECDKALAAIGRIPNTSALGLECADVKTTSKGQIVINDDYQTSQSHIYALGDVANRHNLTPVAIREGHVLADRLFGGNPEQRVNYENIATAVFSNPPLSTVGLTEEEASEKGYAVKIYKSSFKPMKHTISQRDERALMKMVVDAKTDKILGLHMMGMDAPEIMQGFAVALNCGATKADFDRTMPMHPTAAEEFVTMR
ncbi:MAG: glutathione-disulfide reductase [Alphaproteobacteria bacterium]|nr:glutathione-disulfide reductase [Alphaproteobacteria bacterium]